jgi:phosphate transport system substrate-binding protein
MRRASFLILGFLIVMGSPAPPSGSASAGEAPSGPLVFAGSGSNLPITRLLADAFRRVRPDIKIEVPASIGSTGGVRAAADGAITVGLLSRPLREQERGLGLTVVPFARTAVVIGAHPSVADDGISFEDLVQIYRGTKSRWRDGREIIVLTREPGDSSIEVLERVVPGFKQAYAESQSTKRWITLLTDQEMNRLMARTPYAIGLSDMGAITVERLAIKVLKIGGVLPTPETVLSGRYPLVKSLSFAFLKERLPAGAKAFLDFVRSKDGGKILRANGYAPHE